MPGAGLAASSVIHFVHNWLLAGLGSELTVLASHASFFLVLTVSKTKSPQTLFTNLMFKVPGAGLEPARRNWPRILSPLCLPIPSPGRATVIDSLKENQVYC